MATKKKAELKDAPIVKASGGGDIPLSGGDELEEYPVDMIIIKGKSCIASIKIDVNEGTISGDIMVDDLIIPFSTTF